MKLGTQTGSLTNHLYSRMVIGQPAPEAGMGVTILAWTDRYAGTITYVRDHQKRPVITVQRDKATRIDNNGMSESQEYSYAPDPKGTLYWFRQSRGGAWEEVDYSETSKRWGKTGGYGLRIGERAEYRDFSF